MFKIIKNANLYTPAPVGKKDILICGDKIVAIEDSLDAYKFPGEVEVIDVQGATVTPGFFDQHVHLTGGGGEGGPATRVPPVMPSQLLRAGVTTVCGVMGTEGTTKFPEELYAKVMGLRQEGLTAFMHTGSYQFPSPTITGNARKDIIAVEPVLGVKIALADHRCSFPTDDEMLKLVADVRMGGMLSGKKGVLHVHLGDFGGAYEQFERLIARGLARHHFSPTHTGREPKLFEQAIEFAKKGGVIDITSGGGNVYPFVECVERVLKAGVDRSRITMSSDGNGSMPKFDENGNMIAIVAAPVNANHSMLKEMVAAGIDFETALMMTTSNVADSLGVKEARVNVGATANLCVLTKDLDVDTVMARGIVWVQGGQSVKLGNFEA